MNQKEYDKIRLEQLQNISENSISNDLLEKIIIFENEMTNDKDSLFNLLKNEVINLKLFADGVNKVFENFIEKTEKVIGKKNCKKIYGINTGEEIHIINSEKISNFKNQYNKIKIIKNGKIINAKVIKKGEKFKSVVVLAKKEASVKWISQDNKLALLHTKNNNIFFTPLDKKLSKSLHLEDTIIYE